MNVLASYLQGCSGAVVEHLVHSLKVGGSRPPWAQLLFRYTAGKFRWRIKLNRKVRPTWQNFFCSMYEMSQQNHVKPCNSAAVFYPGKQSLQFLYIERAQSKLQKPNMHTS